MEKIILQSIIDKYNLDGLIERVKWTIKDNFIEVKGLSPIKTNLVCEVKAPFTSPDKEFVIYDTTKLLKLLSATDKEINVDFKSGNGKTVKMNITDSSYELEYVLADLMMAPSIPKITEPTYDIEFDIDMNLANKFIKAKKSVDTEIVSITPTQNETLKFIIGDLNEYSDKIKFEHPAKYSVLAIKQLEFPVEILKSIFQDNKCEGKGYLSLDGILKLSFIDNEIESTYYLIAD